MSDLRHAVRLLCKTPMVTLAAILSLALGIGLNTGVFTLLDGVLLRPLPIEHPEELFALSDGKGNVDAFSIPMLQDLRQRQDAFVSLSAWSGGGMANFEVNGELYAASLDTVDGEYFSTLGVRPFLGRMITPADVATRVAVISYRCWKQRYASDPQVLGRTIRIDGTDLTIVGVAPASFTGLEIDAGPDATVPIGYSGKTLYRDRENAWFEIVGRLRPAVTATQAKAQLTAIWPRVLIAAGPKKWEGRIDLLSAATGNSWLRLQLKRPLAILMALVAFVLLIACTNLANLMLARAAAREREFRIRLSLGAGRWHMIRSSVMETLLLVAAGGASAIAVSVTVCRLLIRTFWIGFVPTSISVLPDWRVLVFAAGTAIVSALMTRMPRRLGKLLVSLQAALCVMLVIGAALFAITIHKIRHADPGFRRDGVLLAQLFPQPGRSKIPDRSAYYRELVERLEAMPGLTGASYSYNGPAARAEYQTSVSGTRAEVEHIGPDFFGLLGMHVLAGRDFNWRDDKSSPRVTIVSDSFARSAFPRADAIGQRIEIDHASAQIVGVVNSASLWRMQSYKPRAVYIPLLQAPDYDWPILDIRVNGDPRTFMNAARSIVEAGGHHYPLRMQTLRERSEMMLSNERVLASLSTLLAGLALLMAAIGIYGLLSYSVTRRTAEVGLRMALGAQYHSVVFLVLKEAMLWVMGGLVVGVVAETACSRLLGSILFGVSGTEPVVVLSCGATLALVALVAGFIPARRAARIDPLRALRSE